MNCASVISEILAEKCVYGAQNYKMPLTTSAFYTIASSLRVQNIIVA